MLSSAGPRPRDQQRAIEEDVPGPGGIRVGTTLSTGPAGHRGQRDQRDPRGGGVGNDLSVGKDDAALLEVVFLPGLDKQPAQRAETSPSASIDSALSARTVETMRICSPRTNCQVSRSRRPLHQAIPATVARRIVASAMPAKPITDSPRVRRRDGRFGGLSELGRPREHRDGRRGAGSCTCAAALARSRLLWVMSR